MADTPKALDPNGHDLDSLLTNAAVQALDPAGNDLNDLLTNREVLDARQAARKEIEKERRDAAKKRLIDAEKQRLRNELGMVVGGPEDELVEVEIELSPVQQLAIVINEQSYYHGQRYKVPAHVARTLHEIMWRGWVEEQSISGKPRSEYFAKPRLTAINGKTGTVHNAPARIQ